MKQLFKMLTALTLSFMLVFTSLAAPLMVGTVESVSEEVGALANDSADLAADESNLTPGYNILTGTKEALDFDGAKYDGITSSDGTLKDKNGATVLTYSTGYSKTVSVVASPVSGETDNKALKISDYGNFIGDTSPQTSYPTLMFGNYEPPEDGRPIFVGFKSVVTNADYLYRNSAGKIASSTIGVRFKHSSGYSSKGYCAMNAYNASETPSAWSYIFDTDNSESRTRLTELYMTAKIPSDLLNNKELIDQSKEPNHYIDDIVMIPYYKVTYMNGDTELGSAYVLDDGAGNLLTSFDPSDYDGDDITFPEGTNAWSLEKGGKPTHNITLNNEDIVVYAVHERNFTPGYNLLTGTKDALTFDEAPFTGMNISGTDFIDDDGNVLNTSLGYATEMSVEAPATDSSNKALRITNLTGSSSYPYLVFNDVKVPDDGRPIFTSAKGMVTDIDECSTASNAHGLRINPNGSISGSGAIAGVLAMNAYKSAETTNRQFKQRWVMDQTQGRTKVGVFMFTVSKGTTNIGDITGIKPSVWLDDILYVPYYKVTYMNGDQQIGEPVWVLDDGNGNILESFDPSDYDGDDITFPEGTNAWSLTPGGKPTHNITLNNEDIVVYAVHESNFTPGYNILTGTEEALNFNSVAAGTELTQEGSQYYLKDASGSKVMSATYASSIVASPVPTSDGNVLKMTATCKADGKLYPQLRFNSHESPDDVRPVFISYDMIIQSDNWSGDKSNWIMHEGNVKAASNPIDKVYGTSETPAWQHTAFMDKDAGTKGLAYLQTVTAEGTDNECYYYYDNIMYVPYYKVTYMNGTTELGSAYVLDDGNGNILSSFNPADYDEGIVFPVGVNSWSLTPGGEVVTDIPLRNEDIVVYGTFEVKNTDKTVYAIEYDDNFDTTDTASYLYTRLGYDAVVDGKLVAVSNLVESKNDGILHYNHLNLLASAVQKIEVRAKFTDAGEVQYEEDGTTIIKDASYVGTTPLTADQLKSEYVQIYYKLDDEEYDNYHADRCMTINFLALEADDDGYYTFVFDTAARSDWAGTVEKIRFDLPGIRNTATIDYIRFYGSEGDDFVPTASAPEKREGNSIKFDEELNKTGIRYRAAMNNDVKANTNLTQYGWIVALAETLGGNELTHQFKLADGKTAYVEGIAYGTLSDGTKVNRVYEMEEETQHTIFTAVVVGIPTDKAGMELVIRPYSIINGAYAYGNSIITSPADVAEKLYQKWLTESGDETDTSYDYVNHKEFIDTLRGANA